MQYLIAKRADLDAGDGFMVTPLHLASISNHISTVRLLLDAGANLTRQDSQGDQPLHWAATRGHTEVSRRCHAHVQLMQSVSRAWLQVELAAVAFDDQQLIGCSWLRAVGARAMEHVPSRLHLCLL